MPTFVNFGHVVLRKMEMWKVYDNNADKTDKGQIWIRKKNHMLRWAKILVPCANSLFTKLFFLLAKYYLDLKLRNLGHSNKSSPLITFMQNVVELETSQWLLILHFLQRKYCLYKQLLTILWQFFLCSKMYHPVKIISLVWQWK